MAALLAKDGLDVVLLEREEFPRYHIGESLLASCLPTLRLSGAFDAVAAAGFTVKRGAVFRWQDDEWLLDWRKLVDPDAWSWQVERATYDDILLRNAGKQGATVIERATVRQVHFEDGRPVHLEWTDGTRRRSLAFDFLVDASGRAGVLGRQRVVTRTENELFRNVGVWGYWRGATPFPGSPEGAINVVSAPGGWYWLIPLAGDKWSVGLVTPRDLFTEQRPAHATLDDYYQARIAASADVRTALAGAVFDGPVRAEQDYSYVSERFAGPGFVVVGDAAAFLDPLLSTGVHLAQHSALLGAAAIASTLRGDLPEQRALTFFEHSYRRAYSRMLALVGRMYSEYLGRDEYFAQARPLSQGGNSPAATFTHISAGLTDVGEAGDRGQRVSTATIAGSTKYMGGIDMAPVWNFWRDPFGDDDAVLDDLRLVAEPRLRLAPVAETR